MQWNGGNVRRADKNTTERKDLIPTCGDCDDGWLHCLYRVTRYADGKRLKELVDIPNGEPLRREQIPASENREDRTVRYFTAVKRCPCWEQGLVAENQETEKLEQMPAKIRDVRIGDLVKAMP